MSHLEINKIIPGNQHGFVPHKSAVSNLLECINDWTEYLDKKGCCDVIYFDFSKAFDRVDHSKLLHKIESLEFHPIVVSWIKDYLTERSFQVKVAHSFSTTKPVSSGVPQGGVLSPILFAIYTSDLPVILEGCGVSCKQFADDVKIYRSIRGPSDIESIQSALDAIQMWSETWRLPLAPEKTVFMRMGKSDYDANYSIKNHSLTPVSRVKDLGFHYDNKLDFSEHYKMIYNKASSRTFLIFKALSIVDQEMLLRAYKSYIRPIVEYGSPVFSPSKSKDIALLEKVQDNFTRKLFFRIACSRSIRAPRPVARNSEYKLHSLVSRRKLTDVCVVFKLLTGLIDVDASKFYRIIISRTRGSSEKISYGVPKTNTRSCSFTCRAGSSFISLNSCVPRSSAHYRLFKHMARNKLLHF